MPPLKDAFISYGRPDSKAFAISLYQQLTALGYRVWIDQTDIPFAVNYQTHIDRSIEQVHNLIFILSPHSVNSRHCAEELDQALRFHKRIIPIMHVEEISHATWQRRHPQGTDADWVDYQNRGLHSASRNLHPALAKLNWINFRDGLDDPDQALAQLVQTLENQKTYVHQHTQTLVQALVWHQNQRQPRLLLSGASREAAETWLRQAFETNPPFCQPTDLHSEFIAASTKHADNQLCQVFLWHAEAEGGLKRRSADLAQPNHPYQDRASLSYRVRQLLMRAGFTVWERGQDLALGDRIPEAIAQGIEGADTVVFLLSAQGPQAAHGLDDLAYATRLNKRIIPVLTEPIEAAVLPPTLQNVHCIDLSTASGDLLNHPGSRELIAALRQDAAYFQTHKRLLVQALKWERQRYNPSLLLRGAERRAYQDWLKTAQQRQRYQPVAIQAKFVAESLAQPATQTLDVFLIADPADLDFARRLNNTLQLQGKSTWFEPAGQGGTLDTSSGQESQSAAREALENAQNGLVILSPQALKNPHCLADLDAALALHKRIIGVANGPVTGVNLPPFLAPGPIVDFQDQEGDFSSNFGELYRILESDADHVARHTRLLVRALEWDSASRDDSLLLRGKALDQANTWLGQAEGKVPAPTATQLDYITASGQLPFRRVKRRSVGVSGAAVTLGVFALRLFGGLQPLELAAYDGLMGWRPSEPQDPRLLIVAVDEASGAWLRQQVKQGRYPAGLGTIPDGALAEVLEILAAQEPAAIGLDFFRDFAASPALAEQLRQSDNVFGICKAAYQDSPGVEQPPELPSPQVGFNDFTVDANNFVRRHYLKHEADPPDCDTADAFSLRLAQFYLQGQGVGYTDPFLANGGVQDMALGPVRVPQLWAGGILTSQTGGYTPRNRDDFSGYQTLVNYRQHRGDANQFAPQVTLQALMTGQVDPGLIKGRIVLIGYKDLTDRNADSYNTPLGELTGVVVHGQMISQLTSAALDGRPLMRWWPVWAETLWIGLWAIVGGLVARQLVRPLALGLGGLGAIVLLVSLGYGALVLWGSWLPLVPPLLAGLGTAGLVAYLSRRVRNP
ncbi:MAG: CHASE2 domain-containing protein [Nodosilinea sp.]